MTYRHQEQTTPPYPNYATLEAASSRPTCRPRMRASSYSSTGQRRRAVVDDSGRLLGLLCLKQRLTGFCSDDDVAAREPNAT